MALNRGYLDNSCRTIRESWFSFSIPDNEWDFKRDSEGHMQILNLDGTVQCDIFDFDDIQGQNKADVLERVDKVIMPRFNEFDLLPEVAVNFDVEYYADLEDGALEVCIRVSSDYDKVIIVTTIIKSSADYLDNLNVRYFMNSFIFTK